MAKKKKEKRKLIDVLAAWAVGEESGETKRPFLVERRLKGYTTIAFLFPVMGVLAWMVSKEIFALAFGLLMGFFVFIVGFFQKKRFDDKGYENWKFRVMEQTRLTRFSRTPNGVYADALDGPYKGKMCHIALSGSTVAPAEGQVIELCVPGGIKASLIRDIYYIPEYYGINFMSEGDE